MLKSIEKLAKKFKQETDNQTVRIITHNDTDGITSAAILAKTLERLDKKFSIRILKQLEKEIIEELPKNQPIFFLDLASNSLEHLKDFKKVFILDHHEISKKIPTNINIINPHLFGKEKISSSGITYLFSKALKEKDKELASLAIIGAVGDMLGQDIGVSYNQILKDSELEIKKGPLIYPSTRPINKALEFSSSPFIPGVTGNAKGVFNLLREAGIKKQDKRYKSLIELNEEETSKLLTAILLKRAQNNHDNSKIIGNIYLINFLNKIRDARELSAMINACSRLGKAHIALSICMGHKNKMQEAETLYANYKQQLIAGLNFASNTEKIEKENYTIINAKDKIKDTIIGAVISILSKSGLQKGIIIGMAYSKDKIKVSARATEEEDRNVKELLEEVVSKIGGEVGGHKEAAGCLIEKKHEEEFQKLLREKLEVELVKI